MMVATCKRFLRERTLDSQPLVFHYCPGLQGTDETDANIDALIRAVLAEGIDPDSFHIHYDTDMLMLADTLAQQAFKSGFRSKGVRPIVAVINASCRGQLGNHWFKTNPVSARHAIEENMMRRILFLAISAKIFNEVKYLAIDRPHVWKSVVGFDHKDKELSLIHI